MGESTLNILLGPFLIGLFSLFHCVGMCSGVVSVLTINLSHSILDYKSRLTFYSFIFSIGRISSYTILGVIAGSIGQGLEINLQSFMESEVFRSISAIIIIIMGVATLGFFPILHNMLTGGKRWKPLEKLCTEMLPIETPGQAYIFGMLWGFMPCGLVYTLLLLSMSSANPIHGGITMLAFGIGTLPVLLATGVIIGRIAQFGHSTKSRYMVSSLLIFTGLVMLWFAQTGTHSAH